MARTKGMADKEMECFAEVEAEDVCCDTEDPETDYHVSECQNNQILLK
jgi:hypothetical protein